MSKIIIVPGFHAIEEVLKHIETHLEILKSDEALKLTVIKKNDEDWTIIVEK